MKIINEKCEGVFDEISNLRWSDIFSLREVNDFNPY